MKLILSFAALFLVPSLRVIADDADLIVHHAKVVTVDAKFPSPRPWR